MNLAKSKLRNRIVNINNELVKMGMNEDQVYEFWSSCITKATKQAKNSYCFQCEIEMPVKEKNGVLYCSNCKLIHHN